VGVSVVGNRVGSSVVGKAVGASVVGSIVGLTVGKCVGVGVSTQQIQTFWTV
jgi:hypothetical protein